MKSSPTLEQLTATLRVRNVVAVVAVFIGVPLLLYGLGDFPRRSALKEAISLLTLLALSLMLAQFFLARSNAQVIRLYSLERIKRVHTVIAYSAVSVLLLHPLLIVLPRYLEAGVDPLDAFVTMVTTVDNRGVILGLIAWVLLAALTLTAAFRIRLIKALRIKYPKWRAFHGALSVTLATLAILHVAELGRHATPPMVAFYVLVAVVGTLMLFRMCRAARRRRPSTPHTTGARDEQRT